MIGVAIISFLVAAAVAWSWWKREDAIDVQRQRWRQLIALAEEVLAAGSLDRIARRLGTQLPRILPAASARLYRVDHERALMVRVGNLARDGGVEEILLDSEVKSLTEAPVLCYRNRILLVIPDATVSPLLQGDPSPAAADDSTQKSDPPSTPTASAQGALFAPLVIRGEVLGVLAVYFPGIACPTADDQAAIQHVANQVAIALKLEQQREREENLMQTQQVSSGAERLTAGIIRELRAPLGSIAMLAGELQSRTIEPVVAATLRAIAYEAQRSLELVGRMAAFDEEGSPDEAALEYVPLVTAALDVREREWQVKGLTAQQQFPNKSVLIQGVQSRLDQAFLSLLILVENAASLPDQRTVVFRMHTRQDHAQLFVHYSGDPLEPSGARVVRGIIESHRGTFETRPGTNQSWQIIIELPCHESPAVPVPLDEIAVAEAMEADAVENGNGAASHENGGNGRRDRRTGETRFRRLTALLLEPDPATYRRLMTHLTERGHRVVPVQTIAEAAETASRLTFDIVFCSPQASGGKWTELHDKLRAQIAAFALLADEPVSDPARLFRGAEGYVLTKPIEDAELDRLLTLLQFRLQSV